jgi:hypothetical protein
MPSSGRQADSYRGFILPCFQLEAAKVRSFSSSDDAHLGADHGLYLGFISVLSQFYLSFIPASVCLCGEREAFGFVWVSTLYARSRPFSRILTLTGIYDDHSG